MYAFVYGSLKAGFGNHRILGDSEFVGWARLKDCGTMYSLGAFPAVTLDHETSAIQGEVYDVDEYTLIRLDALEGHPDFYTRTTVTAHVYCPDEECDRLMTVYAYLMPGDSRWLGDDVVLTGNWTQEVRKQKVV